MSGVNTTVPMTPCSAMLQQMRLKIQVLTRRPYAAVQAQAVLLSTQSVLCIRLIMQRTLTVGACRACYTMPHACARLSRAAMPHVRRY
mmetsp:Transcript_16876/g.53564  ORF Transcript_16876/g.53564 Transcript_16876/m.53564 type:complete len:88 (-) Transcript_16876:336-599(-)